MFSLPRDPATLGPEALFPPRTVLNGVLCRYEPSILSYVCYSEFNPCEFSSIHAGVGYWMQAIDPISVSYDSCAPLSGPEQLHYPDAGWHMIGSHQNGDISLLNCSVRNDNTSETKSFEEAWIAGWVQDPLFAYSCANLTYIPTG